MRHGSFIWADLSTFRRDVTEPFYRSVLGWDIDNGLASIAGTPVAQIFTMPDKFQKIGMPSFWMSYIAVDDLAQTIALAGELGGKVELGPEPFEQGQIALIRDPLGAGFTVYSGDALGETATGPGARAGHALFISDAGKIIPFYRALFGWSFGQAVDGVQPVSLDGAPLFHCHTIPDPAVRGPEEYWAVLFAGRNGVAETVDDAGGQVLADITLPEGPAAMVQDPDGGTFIMLNRRGATARPTAKQPWFAWGGLGLVLLSSFTAMQWPWLIFLGAWIWLGLRDKETFLLQRVTQHDHPVTYWVTMLVFTGLWVLVLLSMLEAI